jgi:RNA polymerase sigma-70 factor (ECF subfamily)
MPEPSNIPTRWTLLDRLKDLGDERSWQEFFHTYWRLIYSVALKAGLNDAEAQEVVQETVVAVAKKMPEFRCDPARGSFKGWLLQITWRRIADQRRKQRREGKQFPSRRLLTLTPAGDDGTRTDTVERMSDPAGFDLERVWDEEWEKHLLESALERVKQQAKAEDYQIFDLHVLKKFPVAEVARKLGVKRARVYVVKYRLSALLKQELRNAETLQR